MDLSEILRLYALCLRYLFIFIGDLRFICLLYTSDAADEEDSVDLGGRRIIKKKKKKKFFFFFFLFFFFFFFFKQKTAYEM